MMHVGMNISDKAKLRSGVYRILRTGSLFGIYDIIKSAAPNDVSRALGDNCRYKRGVNSETV